jgi:hypothetical protein
MYLPAIVPVLAAAVVQTPVADDPRTSPNTASQPNPPSYRWPEDDRWTIRFEPSIWYGGPSGSVKLPRDSESAGGNDSTRLRDINLNSTSFVIPTGEVTLRRNRWGITIRGAVLASSRTADGIAGRIGEVPVSNGDDLNVSFDHNQLEIEALYTLCRDALRPREDGGYYLKPRLDLVFGLEAVEQRWIIENTSISPTPPDRSTARADELFVQPRAGLRMSLELLDEFTIDVQVSIAGLPLQETTAASGDVLVGGAWRPLAHLSAQIGYRAVFLALSSGKGDAEMEFEGTIQGLYAGVVVDF